MSIMPSFGGPAYERDRNLIFVLMPLDDHEVVNSANIVEMQAVSGQSFKYVDTDDVIRLC